MENDRPCPLEWELCIVYSVSLDRVRHKMYSAGYDTEILLPERRVMWIREFSWSGPVFVCLSYIAPIFPCLYCNACVYPWGLFAKSSEFLVSAFASVQRLVLISWFPQKALLPVRSAQCWLPAFLFGGNDWGWPHVVVALCFKYLDDLGL